MAKGRPTVTSNAPVVRRALAAFVKQVGPERFEVAARKIAADVVRETTVGISGDTSLPRRVDTGRLRAAWYFTGSRLGVHLGPAREAKPGDGSVTTTRRGDRRSITVANNVEYAVEVEMGTSKMAPGNHLARALGVVVQNLPLSLASAELTADIERAWKGA